MSIIGLCLLSHSTPLVAGANYTSATKELPAEQSSIEVVPSTTRSTRNPSVSLLDKLSADTTTSSYTNRLDFISVIVICSIFALCFIVCVIVGCRRRKRRPPPEELITSQAYSDNESRTVEVRNAGQLDRNANSSNAGRQVESPPPTYSVIERQTSFTSYVSQTSSQFEIPPEYDEDWESGDPAHSNARRSVRPGSRNSRASSRNEPPSAQAVSVATNGASSSSRPLRSESARARGPPKVRPFRTGSETGRQRRQRTSTRPTTVSEDDGFSQSDELTSDASVGIPPRESESLSPDESVHVLVQVEAPPLPTSASSSDAASRNGSRTNAASHNL